MDVKGCKHCGHPVAMTEYHPWCWEAMQAEMRKMRASRLRVHGIDQAFYDQLLADQGGGCGGCGVAPPPGGVLCIDHDHRCCPGKAGCAKCVRGLLCNWCNSAAGLLRDSSSAAAGLARYLLKWEESHV